MRSDDGLVSGGWGGATGALYGTAGTFDASYFPLPCITTTSCSSPSSSSPSSLSCACILVRCASTLPLLLPISAAVAAAAAAGVVVVLLVEGIEERTCCAVRTVLTGAMAFPVTISLLSIPLPFFIILPP